MLNENETLNKIEELANKPDLSAPSPDVGKEPDAKEPSTLQETVQDALDARGAEDAANSSDANAQQEEKPAEEVKAEEPLVEKKEPNEEPTAEEKKKLEEENARFDKHPRFQELNEKVKTLEPWAKQAQYDQQFSRANNISEKQKADAFNLLALINRDPKAALPKLKEIVEQLELSTGAKLPPDLAKKVEDSLITEETAKEIQSLRLDKQRQEALVQQQEQRAQATVAQQVNQSLGEWALSKQTVDPVFKPKPQETSPDGKWEMVRDRAAILASRSNEPHTPANAVKIFEQAYVDVTNYEKQLSPPARARKRLPFNGSFDQSTGAPAKSLRDAVGKELQRKHGITLVDDSEQN